MNLIKQFVLVIFIIFAFLLTGCSTPVPITPNFPAVPDMLMEECPVLKTIDGETVSIIDFTKTVNINYTTYYECATKHSAWIDWYKQQKSIFEEIK